MKIFLTAFVFVVLFSTTVPVFGAESARQPKKVDLTCMTAAVNTREVAVALAMEKLHTSMISGLSERKASLVAGWALEDRSARRNALKDAWKRFREVRKHAVVTHRAETKTAWAEFRKAAKTCKGSVADEGVNTKEETFDAEVAPVGV